MMHKDSELLIVERMGNPFEWSTREEQINYIADEMADFEYTYSSIINEPITDDDLEKIKNLQTSTFGFINVLCKIDNTRVISYVFNFNDEVIDILEKYQLSKSRRIHVFSDKIFSDVRKYNGKYEGAVYFVTDIYEIESIKYLLLVLNDEQLEYLSSLMHDFSSKKYDIVFINKCIKTNDSGFLKELKEFVNNGNWRENIDKFLLDQYRFLEARRLE